MRCVLLVNHINLLAVSLKAKGRKLSETNVTGKNPFQKAIIQCSNLGHGSDGSVKVENAKPKTHRLQLLCGNLGHGPEGSIMVDDAKPITDRMQLLVAPSNC